MENYFMPNDGIRLAVNSSSSEYRQIIQNFLAEHQEDRPILAMWSSWSWQCYGIMVGNTECDSTFYQLLFKDVQVQLAKLRLQDPPAT